MFSWRYVALRKFHSSVFIAFTALGFIFGIVLSLVSPQELLNVSWLVLVAILLLISFIWQRAWLVILAMFAGLLLGLWRGDTQLARIHGYQQYVGRTITMAGTVSEDVAEGKHGDIQVELSQVRINNRALPEKVWLSLHAKTILKRSDKLTVSGKLKPGFGSFAASMNFAKVVKVSKGIDQARDIRDWFAGIITKVIGQPQAGLGLGFLVGQRSSLPVELDDQLRIVGLTHIVVASGYNLTILVRLARRLLAGVSKYLTAASSCLMIAGFMLVTGFSPSMSRAGLVAVLSLAAWYYGRKISPFVLLPLVAALTLMVNPSFAWGDVGWYLSFAAFGGVMIAAPLMQQYFFGKAKPSFIRQILGETIAALLVTAPIIMFVFGQYSPYAIISNLLVVPTIPYIMLAVFLTGVISLALPILALPISLPAVGLLHYVTTIVQWIASLPGAKIEVTLSPLGMVLYYLLLCLIGFYMWFKTKHTFRDDNIIA